MTEANDAPPKREALIDWLSCTVKVGDALAAYLLNLFGDAVEATGHGASGYNTAMKTPGAGLVAWGGNKETMLFSFKGKTLGWLREQGVDVAQLVKDVYEGGAHITRLDVAWDDRSGSFTVPEFADAVEAGEMVSRWRVWKVWRGLRGYQGYTVYGGSAKSDSRLCVYDKAAERTVSGEDVEGEWVRVEWRTRREVAMAVAKLIAEGNLDAVAAGLRGYCDWKIPNPGDSNWRRWPVRPCWVDLLGVVRRKLEVEKPTCTMAGSQQWAETQWCNTAGALRVALGPVSFTQWWQEMVKSGDEDKIKARLAEWGVTPQVLGSGLALEHAPAIDD